MIEEEKKIISEIEVIESKNEIKYEDRFDLFTFDF